MGTSKTELKIFVASPSGLDEERDAVSKIAERMNQSISDSLDVIVRVEKWEHLIGSAGRPQALINKFVEDCDVFIGLIPDLNSRRYLSSSQISNTPTLRYITHTSLSMSFG